MPESKPPTACALKYLPGLLVLLLIACDRPPTERPNVTAHMHCSEVQAQFPHYRWTSEPARHLNEMGGTRITADDFCQLAAEVEAIQRALARR